MDNVLLFITGVLSGLIAGFILVPLLPKSRIRSDGSRESLLEENLRKADQALEKYARELENQKRELKEERHVAQDEKEKAIKSSADLNAVTKERDKLQNSHQKTLEDLESLREAKDSLGRQNVQLLGDLKKQEENL